MIYLSYKRNEMKLLKIAMGVVAAGTIAGVVGTYVIAKHVFNSIIVRSNAKREQTQEMAGTEWEEYIPKIRECREKLILMPHEEMYIKSNDGLKLHATFFPCQDSKKVVICFHGYTSEGLNDYTTLAVFYANNGYNLLIVDDRAHGQSEGQYVGFGCLDRYDAKLWINTMINKIGEDCRILLHGDSMGGATVLMTTGFELPPQVKAAVSDCAFTSAWEVFSHVMKAKYHLPPTPIMKITNHIALHNLMLSKN